LDRSGGPDGMNPSRIPATSAERPTQGYYAVSVSGNWRVTFRFEDRHAVEVDYQDYH
jgi:proteic killer suppression protein